MGVWRLQQAQQPHRQLCDAGVAVTAVGVCQLYGRASRVDRASFVLHILVFVHMHMVPEVKRSGRILVFAIHG